MTRKSHQIIALLDGARTAAEFATAERLARRLSPIDQLEVVEAYRAARARNYQEAA